MASVGEYVQIILSNNFSYRGLILEVDDYFITIRDRYQKKVSLAKRDIQTIKEAVL